jgi:hypothetical protein
VTSTTAALTAAFASQAAVAAPESLATRVIGAAFAGAASRGGAITAMKLFLAMNKISAGIVGGILAVGLITAVLEVRANRALNAEVDALQANVQGLSSAAMIGTPKVKNDDAEELARLRLRIAQLKGRPEGVVDSAMIPREAWRNVGRATPAAALETLMWAHSVHDMDAVADSYAFSEGSKRIIDAWFAGLNENVRAKFGTPERLLAPLLRPLSGDQTDPVVAYQVIDQQGDLGSNDVKIPFWVQLSSGQERQAENGSTEFINSAEGWKKYARGPATEADFEKMVFSQIDPETGDPLPGGTKGSADENRQSPP